LVSLWDYILIMDRKLLFTERAQAESRKVSMLLTKPIGIDHKNPTAPYIDGTAFAEEMYWLKAQGYDITIKINSIGGNVIQGWTILDAVESTEANTHLIGIGASMAGVIFLGGKKKTAEPYGTLMLHAAHGSNGHYKEIVNAQFREMLTSRTKFATEKIDAILKEGDHYFDASDMINYGLVDEAPVSRNIKVFTRPVNASVAELFEMYNSLNETENLKPKKDMDIFAKLFGGKDEQETLALAVSAKSDNDKMKAEVEAKEKEIVALQAKVAQFEKATNEAKAVELIEKAITDGKLQNIADADKAKLIATATANFDSVKLMLDGVPVATKKKVASVSASIDETEGKKVTYEYLAKNEPEKLNAIFESDPALYARLEKEFLEEQSKSN